MEEGRRAIKRWNQRWKDTPRKLLAGALVLLSVGLLVGLLPYIGPFVLAFCLAYLMRPLVRVLRRAFAKLPFGHGLATLVAMALVFGFIGAAVGALVSRLAQELLALARTAPETVRLVTAQAAAWVEAWEAQGEFALSPAVGELLTTLLAELGKLLLSFASTLSATLATGAVSTAASLPRGLLALVLTLMSTYTFSSDEERICAFLRAHLPENIWEGAGRVRRGALHALGRQIRAQALVSLIVTGVVMLGMVILRRPYALVIGLGIGLADALPVIGAGLFLLPWSVWGFLSGDTFLGWGMLLLYGAVVLVRQIVEPRIVGRSLGLHPLATMMSMFIGLQLTGFAGLLLGPLLLTLCLAVQKELNQYM